jgi:hypothetical protein
MRPVRRLLFLTRGLDARNCDEVSAAALGGRYGGLRCCRARLHALGALHPMKFTTNAKHLDDECRGIRHPAKEAWERAWQVAYRWKPRGTLPRNVDYKRAHWRWVKAAHLFAQETVK